MKKHKQYKMINEINNYIVYQMAEHDCDDVVEAAWDAVSTSQEELYEIWETIYLSIMGV